MKFDPSLFYSCPTCSKILLNSSIPTSNSRIVDVYSDGRVTTLCPHIENLRISKCNHCNTIFWINKLKNTSDLRINPSDLSKLWLKTIKDPKTDFYSNKEIKISWLKWSLELNKLNIVSLEFLDIDDYWRALQEGLPSNNEEEVYIRIKIWRAQNDRIRNLKTISKNYFKNNNIWSDNIKSLIKILDNTKDEHKFIRADLYRNLGEFDLCKEILDEINQPKMQRLKEFILKQCELKYRWVININNIFVIF